MSIIRLEDLDFKRDRDSLLDEVDDLKDLKNILLNGVIENE